ncbi:MAG: hypothetical protein ACTSRZ_13390 [Promethearchaeota archaeon]
MAKKKKDKNKLPDLPDSFGFIGKSGKKKTNLDSNKEMQDSASKYGFSPLPKLGKSSLSSSSSSSSSLFSSSSSSSSSTQQRPSSKTSHSTYRKDNSNKKAISLPKTSKSNVFELTSKSEIIQYQKSWPEMLSDIEHWTPFPYTIGIEMELIIANNKGEYIEGEEATFRMKEIVREAQKLMNSIINNEIQDESFPPMPEYIRSKLGLQAYTARDEEKGLTMNLRYRNDLTGQHVDIQSFGRDGNITATTYILELVTPICMYAEELAYWASTLFQLAKKTLPKDLNIIATALNPTIKEYTRGLSHGDHNHIGGFADDVERAMCYNMLRNFIPHIIALSVNSPFINNKPTDQVKSIIDKKTGKPRYTAPNCVRSLRLKYNTTMLSGNDPKSYIPYITNVDERNKQYMLQILKKKDWYDARYQDVFPLTDFGTIEVRIMDAQISICRRIGLAMLNLALCYKAKKLYQSGKYTPNVTSETITYNRKNVINRGLIAPWKNINTDRNQLNMFDPTFADCYFGPENQPFRYAFQAVQGMFHYIKEELKELNFLYSPFLKPLLQSVFGEIDYAEPPMSEADYQLCLYDYKLKQGEEPNILNDLIYFTLEYSKDPLSQPLTGQLRLPESMIK